MPSARLSGELGWGGAGFDVGADLASASAGYVYRGGDHWFYDDDCYRTALGGEAAVSMGIGAGGSFDWRTGVSFNAAFGLGIGVSLTWGEKKAGCNCE